MQGFLWG